MAKQGGMPERIVAFLQKAGPMGVARLGRHFRLSRQALHRHLRSLLADRRILRMGRTRRARYLLNTPAQVQRHFGTDRGFHRRYQVAGLAEDRVVAEVRLEWAGYRRLRPTAQRIVDYALAEMVNNAIEHSASRMVVVVVRRRGPDATFAVIDRGVGIYRRLREKLGLTQSIEAIQELLKGKATTDPERHSGEGIFFTSKAADFFTISSEQTQVAFDNRRADVYVNHVRTRRGTAVHFAVAADTAKSLEAIFAEYTTGEYAFEKTRVRVKLFAGAHTYLSRSEARRLLARCESFREVVLDFTGVTTIGQAFADEVFRVFARAYPDITIRAVSTAPAVDFMIRHVQHAPSAQPTNIASP